MPDILFRRRYGIALPDGYDESSPVTPQEMRDQAAAKRLILTYEPLPIADIVMPIPSAIPVALSQTVLEIKPPCRAEEVRDEIAANDHAKANLMQQQTALEQEAGAICREAAAALEQTINAAMNAECVAPGL